MPPLVGQRRKKGKRKRKSDPPPPAAAGQPTCGVCPNQAQVFCETCAHNLCADCNSCFHVNTDLFTHMTTLSEPRLLTAEALTVVSYQRLNDELRERRKVYKVHMYEAHKGQKKRARLQKKELAKAQQQLAEVRAQLEEAHQNSHPSIAPAVHHVPDMTFQDPGQWLQFTEGLLLGAATSQAQLHHAQQAHASTQAQLQQAHAAAVVHASTLHHVQHQCSTLARENTVLSEKSTKYQRLYYNEKRAIKRLQASAPRTGPQSVRRFCKPLLPLSQITSPWYQKSEESRRLLLLAEETEAFRVGMASTLNIDTSAVDDVQVTYQGIAVNTQLVSDDEYDDGDFTCDSIAASVLSKDVVMPQLQTQREQKERQHAKEEAARMETLKKEMRLVADIDASLLSRRQVEMFMHHLKPQDGTCTASSIRRAQERLEADRKAAIPFITFDKGVMANLPKLLQELAKLHNLPQDVKWFINFGADGRVHTRRLSSVITGFNICIEGPDGTVNDLHSAKSKHYHTLAVWKGKEERPVMEPSFNLIFKQITDLMESPDHNVEVTWSSDMKMSLLLGGLAPANAGGEAEVCGFCSCTTKQRHSQDLKHADFTIDPNRFKDVPGDLLHFLSPSHRVLDVLHTNLRICDRQLDWNIKRIIAKCVTLADENAACNGICAAMKKIGIPFRFYLKFADGKSGGKLGHTSLQGPQYTKMLEEFKWGDFLPADEAKVVQDIWDSWGSLYRILKSRTPLTEPQRTPIPDPPPTPLVALEAVTDKSTLDWMLAELIGPLGFDGVQWARMSPEQVDAYTDALAYLRNARLPDEATTKSGVTQSCAKVMNRFLGKTLRRAIDFTSTWDEIKHRCLEVVTRPGFLEAQPAGLRVRRWDVDDAEEDEQKDDEVQETVSDGEDEEESHQQSWKRTPEDIHDLCKRWLRLFAAESILIPGHPAIFRGYGADAVTPYIHQTVAHAWELIAQWGSLYRFSCQAMERKNAFHTRQLIQCGLKWGPWEKRMLSKCCRMVLNPPDDSHPFMCRTCEKSYTRKGDCQNHIRDNKACCIALSEVVANPNHKKVK